MVKVVIDSDVIIEKIRRGTGIYDKLVEKQAEGKVKLLIPTVVISELWTGDSMNNKKEEESVEILIKYFKRIVINDDVAKMGGSIVRKYKVKAMDALIGACALLGGAKLATYNKKDFMRIKGLKFYGGKID